MFLGGSSIWLKRNGTFRGNVVCGLNETTPFEEKVAVGFSETIHVYIYIHITLHNMVIYVHYTRTIYIYIYIHQVTRPVPIGVRGICK